MKTDVISLLQNGGVGVLATDTLYGLVGRALDQTVVERVYQLKRRQPDKPCIILISDYADLASFGIKLTDELKSQLETYWPGAVSVILPCWVDELEYLHRGTKSLAFRLPAKPELRHLITQTGPLVAPSANPEGEPVPQTIAEAEAYFGSQADFYQSGPTTDQPSKLIKLVDGQVVTLRD